MIFEPTEAEVQRRNEVLGAILEATARGVTIKLPDFDPRISRSGGDVAGSTVGIEPNSFGGSVGEFRYQFEGEEDLLHLIVTRLDQGEVSVGEGQAVAEFLLYAVPKALIWMKPGTITQHFYLGHDDLEQAMTQSPGKDLFRNL